MADETVLTAQTSTDAGDGSGEGSEGKTGSEGTPQPGEGTTGNQIGNESDGKTGQEGADGNGEEGKDGDGKSDEGAPEQYEAFTLPEGVNIPEEQLGEFTAVAKELNLSQEQAQKLVDLEAQRVEQLQKQFADQQIEAWNNQVNEWASQSKSDQEIGGQQFDENVAIGVKALDQFGTPELKEVLEQTGLGSHPEVVRFMHRVGKQLAEDTAVGGGQGGERSVAEKLYPSMKQQS